MKLLLSIIISILFTNCGELFQRESASNKSKQALALLVISATTPAGCKVNNITVQGQSATEYLVSECETGGLSALGLTGSEVSKGLVGSSAASKLGNSRSFTSGGENKVNVEVTYTLNSSSSVFQVYMLSSASGASMTGPSFKITPTSIVPVDNAGADGTMTSGGAITSPVGTQKTMCLEMHSESGAHFIGWNKPCSNLTSSDKGTYEIEKDGFTTTTPGNNIGFLLNGVTLTKFIVTSKLGTSARMLEP